MQILVKSGFADTCKLRNLAHSVLLCLVEFDSLADGSLVYRAPSAFSSSCTSGGKPLARPVKED